MAAPYISTRRFLDVAGLGIDTSFLSLAQMRGNLARATTMVNAWTSQAQIPVPFDFRGGSVVHEQHEFAIPSPLTFGPGSRRVFVNQLPLRAVTGFSIQFTPSYRIDLNTANDIYVNASEGWCEIIASQPTIVGFPPIGYWYGLYTPVASLDYTYGYRVPLADDPLDAVSPVLWYGSAGSWDTGSPVEVTVDGVIADPASYSVRHADGSVLFTTRPPAQAEVSATYTSLIPAAVEQATAVVAADLVGKARNTQRMPGLSSMKVAEITLERLTGDRGRYVTRNGISIPEDAAVLLGNVNRGKAA
jgi:hypothetical protein